LTPLKSNISQKKDKEATQFFILINVLLLTKDFNICLTNVFSGTNEHCLLNHNLEKQNKRVISLCLFRNFDNYELFYDKQ
jgi:hypothetical protein